MTWMNPPGGAFLRTSSYRDPKQGCLNDCILIAGLSSYAWCSAAFPPNAAPDSSGFYSITFYPNRIARVARVSRMLCYEGSALPFASSIDPGELWPAYYEKAYAAFLMAGRTSVSIDQFSMRSVAFGRNGKQVMEDLTNYTYNDPELSTIPDAYNFINGQCLNGKTRKPMIAWTLSTSVAAGLKTDHAYSVLGVTDASYIVLRDPRRVAVEPTANVLKNKIITLGAINLGDTGDGIFALHKDTFKSSFFKLAFSP